MPLGRETPAVVATFDELRENGFVEGKNLEVVSGSFNVGINKIADIAPIIVKAEPDANPAAARSSTSANFRN